TTTTTTTIPPETTTTTESTTTTLPSETTTTTIESTTTTTTLPPEETTTTTNPPETTTTTEPISFLKKLFQFLTPKVKAEETTSTTLPEESTTTTTLPSETTTITEPTTTTIPQETTTTTESTTTTTESTTTTPVTSSLIFSNFDLGENLFDQIIPQNIQLRFSLAGKGQEGDKLMISYFYHDQWQNSGELDLSNEISNNTNGGYFLYALPVFDNPEELQNLKIKFQALGSKTQEVYLDSVWLEVEYGEEGKEIEEPEISQEFLGAAGPGQIFEDVFPIFVEGGWQQPENALNRDLTPSGFFEEFSYENSAHFNQKIAAEKIKKEEEIIQETEENQGERQEISAELKNSLVFWGFSSPNVDKNFYRAYLRISLAARHTLELKNERLVIEYSLDGGSSWQPMGKISISGEISNQINGGYWSFPLNSISTWQNLNNLKIKVTYKNSLDLMNDEVLVFLDNVWLEVLRNEPSNLQQNLDSKPSEVIAESDGNDQEIFVVLNNSQRVQITQNNYDDRNPKINQKKDLICWEAEIDGRWQIMIAEAPDWKISQLSEKEVTNLNCQVDEIRVLWQAWINNNWEIMMAEKKLFGGWSVKQLTENNIPDINPEFSENKIIWEKSEGKIGEIKEGLWQKIKEIIF
ncbi:MAG: hypothetical protein NTX26_00085, partial [Candidatus Parcubacteria bacterium]|nr:hypothetical protein [Candidatus Parcubacteria bacterium]